MGALDATVSLLSDLGHEVTEVTPDWDDPSLVPMFIHVVQTSAAYHEDTDIEKLEPLNRMLAGSAKQTGSHPKTWTYGNIAAMKGQLKTMGLSFDWTREVATCDPAYYHQQQKLFTDMLKAGLVTRKKSKVNWDPVDETVLEAGGRRIALEEVSEPRPGQSFAFVMDTRQCRAAVDLARGVDLLVCESTYLSTEEDLASTYAHLTAAQAAQIAAEAGARRIVLTHFSQRHPDETVFAAEARRIFADVHAARDLDRVDVPERR